MTPEGEQCERQWWRQQRFRVNRQHQALELNQRIQDWIIAQLTHREPEWESAWGKKGQWRKYSPGQTPSRYRAVGAYMRICIDAQERREEGGPAS